MPSPENRTKQVQVDELTFDVIGEREGGFGKVWFLRRPSGAPFHVVYGHQCAVKTFRAEEDVDQALIEQELGNWVSLRDPHIARLIKISRLNFELAALMEMMPGSLADYLRRYRRLDSKLVKTVLLDVLKGLNYAYSEQRLVHLDLKPGNLLLISADSARVQITDWGISRIAATTATSKQLGGSGKGPAHHTVEKTRFAAGTIPYMAPERFSESWAIGPAADVFSLGAIALELMTGQLPWIDDSTITSLEYFERAKYLLQRMGTDLRSLMLSMLDPDPRRRPQDYATLISALEKI
jgi:eukaryotic-like serine/threonine-protein kinase